MIINNTLEDIEEEEDEQKIVEILNESEDENNLDKELEKELKELENDLKETDNNEK